MRDPSPGARDRLLAGRREHDDRPTKSAPAPEATADHGEAQATAGTRRSGPYESWTVEDLRERAAELGIPERSTLRRAELIEALRAH
jgi:hypothetical protein